MCGCSPHALEKAERPVVSEAHGFALRVEDMTCGNCAATIRKAVEAALPGTQVNPDPATKLAAVRDTTDCAVARAAIAAAGYTPSEAVRSCDEPAPGAPRPSGWIREVPLIRR
jgi:copper chaperone